MDDMILVSIDDHMIEPPDMFENHVPEKWKDSVPEVDVTRKPRAQWKMENEAAAIGVA